MTKGMIQQRANQLTRELHNLERGEAIIREIDERRNKHRDEDSSNCLTLNGKKKAAKQTALESFFSRTTSVKKASSVVILTDTEDEEKNNKSAVEVIDVDMSPQRQEVAESEEQKVDEDRSGDVKPVSGFKRRESSSSSSEVSPSQEKKLRVA